MNQAKEYTITVFSENKIGLLSRLALVFTRRKINIESIVASESAISGIHKFTVVVCVTPQMIEHLSKQINKLVEVLMCYYHTADEVVYQEVALYKVPTKQLIENDHIEKLVRKHEARILEVTPVFTAIEKTGHKDETQNLFEELKNYGVLQFVRSGRIAITRSAEEKLSAYLERMENE